MTFSPRERGASGGAAVAETHAGVVFFVGDRAYKLKKGLDLGFLDFRTDVLADVAFLVMDLERLGRGDLAASFLEQYREAVGDRWPPSLADHYIAYRAQVRTKVGCLRWSQGEADSREAARRLLRLCLDHSRRARVRLVLVGGPPGTG
ncbi:MAG TPA: hypothetical protein VM388_12670 [Acidimicrobiales bacterium]|nr:hypothetical protein [Acidimicrobiales bacterium]